MYGPVDRFRITCGEDDDSIHIGKGFIEELPKDGKKSDDLEH